MSVFFSNTIFPTFFCCKHLYANPYSSPGKIGSPSTLVDLTFWLVWREGIPHGEHSLNGGTPISHPKMIILSRNTYGCWVPPFLGNTHIAAK